MVDCGWAGSAEPVRGAVEKILGPGAVPAAIFLTHIHPDHSGAAGALARLWEVPVYAHEAEPAHGGGKVHSGVFRAIGPVVHCPCPVVVAYPRTPAD
ncbi:MBL fold metallo-hydrolase [Pseudarthrobacter sp. Fe7]|nr:MBL fold metallo-hydrolase [Pseudarthrobacter sp. Fe7]